MRLRRDGVPLARETNLDATALDRRLIRGLAAASLLALVGLALLRVFAPPVIAPRVNVRWAPGVSASARTALEERFRLFVGELREGTTWAYDMGDPSPSAVGALIRHPAVEDTSRVYRRLGIVAFDAPRGTTRLRGGVLSALRDSPMFEWLTLFCSAALLSSTMWLALTSRVARQVTRPGT